MSSPTTTTLNSFPQRSRAHSSSRQKVPKEERKRVAAACNRCKSRRIKCSGDRPCKGCLDADANCVYPPDEKRIYISASYVHEIEQKNAALESEVRSLQEHINSQPLSLFPPSPSPQLQAQNEAEDDRDTLEGFAEQIAKLLVDPSGHARYIGDSAGAAYIDRVRSFVKGSLYPDADFSHYLNYYHTWDSRPIAFVPQEPYGLPARAIASSLINSLFATYPPEIFYLVHPTILSQFLDACYQDPVHNHCVLALVNAALALGAQASGLAETEEETSPGMEFFARVKLLLATVLEDNNILSVQTLNILALFLWGANRRDAAYTYIGMAMRIALAHGLHRRSTNHATNPSTLNISIATLQNNVRIWWTTYIIERSSEFLMGRPSQIRDEDIDREAVSDTPGFPSADGLRAHVGLATIMGQILSQVFRTRRRRKEDADEALMHLRQWKDSLPPALRLSDDEFSSPSRSVLLLHLNYNQLILVILRTSILEYIISQSGDLFNPDPFPPHSDLFPNLRPTLQAARQNLLLSHSLAPLSPYTFHSFHFIFSAAIAIVVQSFLPNETTPSDSLLVSQAVNTLTELGKINESAESCSKMTRDLNVVVENVKMVRDGTRGELAELSFSPTRARGSEDMIYFSV